MGSSRTLIASLTAFAVATAFFIGYAFYFDHRRKRDKILRKRIKSERNKEISKQKKSTTRTNVSSASSIIEMIPEMALTLEDIYAMPPPDRERIFYSLLVKGEELLSFQSDESNLMKAYSEAATQLFFKAIKMIPNPTELLVSLQQVLPKDVFNALTKLITEDGLKRIVTYFASIVPSGVPINIAPKNLLLANGEMEQTWAVFASKDIPPNTVLYEEHPDAASLFLDSNTKSFCDNCFKPVLENTVICSKCSDAVYCSQDCLSRASMSHHSTLCGNEQTKELCKVARADHSEYALLVARYLAVLCAEEKKIREKKEKPTMTASSHFEYMKPLLLPTLPSDEKVATVLKLLFAQVSPDIIEHLNDQRYSSIKGALIFNSIGISYETQSSASVPFSERSASDASAKENTPSDANMTLAAKEKSRTEHSESSPVAELSAEPSGKQDEDSLSCADDATITSSPAILDSPIVESIHSNVSSDEGQAISINELIEHTRSSCQKTELIGHGLYHISAHLQHSCDPNVRLSFPYNNNILRVTTARHIEKGDEITMTYIPLASGMSSNARRTALKRSYHIDCSCVLCEAELTIA